MLGFETQADKLFHPWADLYMDAKDYTTNKLILLYTPRSIDMQTYYSPTSQHSQPFPNFRIKNTKE
jgi:hypothetical protein